jgi:hypothetical protein
VWEATHPVGIVTLPSLVCRRSAPFPVGLGLEHRRRNAFLVHRRPPPLPLLASLALPLCSLRRSILASMLLLPDRFFGPGALERRLSVWNWVGFGWLKLVLWDGDGVGK